MTWSISNFTIMCYVESWGRKKTSAGASCRGLFSRPDRRVLGNQIQDLGERFGVPRLHIHILEDDDTNRTRRRPGVGVNQDVGTGSPHGEDQLAEVAEDEGREGAAG